MALLEPLHIMEDGDGAGFDAAMIALDGLIGADFGLLEPVGLLFSGKLLDVLAQRALITFEGKDVVGFFVDDFLRNGTLATHRVDGYDGALNGHQLE